MTNEYPNIFALEKINEYLDEWIYSSKFIRIYSNIHPTLVRNFFWNDQSELTFYKIFTKTNKFTSLVKKSLRKFLWTIFLRFFVGFSIKFIFRIGCFTQTFWFSFRLKCLARPNCLFLPYERLHMGITYPLR